MALFRVRLAVKSNKFLLPTLLTCFLSLYLYKSAAFIMEKRYVTTLSWALAGKTIVIDPGHGGEDPGALGTTGVHEKDIVLEVSKKLSAILRQAGARVILTREDDRDLSEPGAKSQHQAKLQDLTRRVELANRSHADIFISIHVNSFPDPREDGPQTFSQPGSAESKRLAVAIQRELNRYLENPGREAKQVDYFTTRMTEMPSVIVEIGFITNPREEKLLLDPVYQGKIAWAIYAGIARYFSLPKAACTDSKIT